MLSNSLKRKLGSEQYKQAGRTAWLGMRWDGVQRCDSEGQPETRLRHSLARAGLLLRNGGNGKQRKGKVGLCGLGGVPDNPTRALVAALSIRMAVATLSKALAIGWRASSLFGFRIATSCRVSP